MGQTDGRTPYRFAYYAGSANKLQKSQLPTAADGPARRAESRPSCCTQRWTLSVINWWRSTIKLRSLHLRQSTFPWRHITHSMLRNIVRRWNQEVLKAVVQSINYGILYGRLSRYAANILLIIISISLPPHSFIPGLKLPFLQILLTVAYLFFFRTDSTDSPDCLPILLSISGFFFIF